MPCERFREAIAGHAAGAEIDTGAAKHLASCPACAARLQTQRRLLAEVDAELARALAIEASPEFAAGVAARVSLPTRRPILWRPATAWIGLAAAAAIVMVSFLWMPGAPAPQPPPESASAAPAPARLPVVANVTAGAVPDFQPVIRRSPVRSSRAVTTARRADEPPVIVQPDQARAIARLRELLSTGRLTEEMLPPEHAHRAADLAVAPLEIPEIQVPDVEAIGRTPGSAVEQEPKEQSR
jgi:hypothetical protein